MTRAKNPRQKEVVAYCWRNGMIEIGAYLPDLALPLMAGERKFVRSTIRGAARLAYDNKTWLVPGVPEAESDDAAYQAVLDFEHLLQFSEV
jgi:hypothetical protein